MLFDFAGYSDIAIGVGLLFGVQLPYNFNAPMRSDQPAGLLAALAHDADDVPARLRLRPAVQRQASAGGTIGCVQHFSAMLLTMALCGLWHGASWTFVLWGTLHGCALVIVSLWRRYGPRLPCVARLGADGLVRAADLRDLPRRYRSRPR